MTRNRKTSFEVVSLEWVAHIRISVKPATYATYRTLLMKHLIPEFGKRSIESITVPEFDALTTRMLYEDELSAGTLRLVVTVMREILYYAGAHGCSVMDPRMLKCPQAEHPDVHVLAQGEKKKLIACCLTDTDGPKLGVILSLYMGLRIGELCALRWSRIDTKNFTLSVTSSMQRITNPAGDKGPKTMVVTGSPKSSASHRILPIPECLHGLVASMQLAPETYVLSGTTHRIEPRCYRNLYNAILKEAGVGQTNFHVLRHTFATDCVGLGFDPKTLSEILGHSSVNITFNTYVHPSMDNMKRCMGKLEL